MSYLRDHQGIKKEIQVPTSSWETSQINEFSYLHKALSKWHPHATDPWGWEQEPSTAQYYLGKSGYAGVVVCQDVYMRHNPTDTASIT